MSDLEINFLNRNGAKQIEDVIDARKKVGQYNVCKKKSDSDRLSDQVSISTISEYSLDDNEATAYFPCQTDSEVTVVRVKREGMQYRSYENKWNLNDDAIPGDGSHLGESPSLVNLVTLVGQTYNFEEYKEFLVPISSWDPGDHPRDFVNITNDCSQSRQPKVKNFVGKLANIMRKTGIKKSISSAFVTKSTSKVGKLLFQKTPKKPS